MANLSQAIANGRTVGNERAHHKHGEGKIAGRELDARHQVDQIVVEFLLVEQDVQVHGDVVRQRDGQACQSETRLHELPLAPIETRRHRPQAAQRHQRHEHIGHQAGEHVDLAVQRELVRRARTAVAIPVGQIGGRCDQKRAHHVHGGDEEGVEAELLARAQPGVEEAWKATLRGAPRQLVDGRHHARHVDEGEQLEGAEAEHLVQVGEHGEVSEVLLERVRLLGKDEVVDERPGRVEEHEEQRDERRIAPLGERARVRQLELSAARQRTGVARHKANASA